MNNKYVIGIALFFASFIWPHWAKPQGGTHRVISRCETTTGWEGGTRTTHLKKEGDAALSWHHGTQHILKLTDYPKNISAYQTLSFWMHSNTNNGQKFQLVIHSENPATNGPDYYIQTLEANYEGWQLVRLDLNQLSKGRKPLGLHRITSFQLYADGWGQTPNPANTITIDYMMLSKANEMPTLTINDCNHLDDWNGGTLTTQRKEGTHALRWAQSEHGSVSLRNYPKDWRGFGTLSFWMHSNVANGQRFNLVVYSENPATSGIDYYLYTLMADFKGWKEIVIPIAELRAQRTPLGLDKISGVTFTASGWGNTPNPANVILMDDIRLEGSHLANSFVVSRCESDLPWQGGSIVQNPKKEGNGALRWRHGQDNAVALHSFPTDISGYGTLSFWMHSNMANNQGFVLILGSENDATADSDYYWANLKADFTGWKNFNLRLDDLRVARKPLGFNKITSVFFTANGWGNTPNAANEIVIDHITLGGSRLIKDLPNHPRLIVKGGWEGIKAKVNRLAATRAIKDRVVQKATTMLNEPVATYQIPDGKRLLATSRKVLDRIYHLAFAYRMTGDRRFLNRAYAELESAANFPDWNPSHFLDTGEMAHAFAIGYDWLYDALTSSQKQVVRAAIIKHGLNTYLKGHRENAWWLRSAYNWNTVCNGGIGVAALAIAEHDLALSNDVLGKTLNSLKSSGVMEQFAPDGAWPESPGYWRYATQYLFVFAAALETSIGSTQGLLDYPGIEATGEFPVYMESPTRLMFNYAEGGTGRMRAPWQFWLSQKFNNPLLSWAQQRAHNNDVLDAIWYVPQANAPDDLGLPRDRLFKKVEVVSLRSQWDDDQALFVGFKAGDNNVGHSHLDLGEFVLDVHGQRWIHDQGTDNYNLPGYFAGNEWDSKRWEYYRLRAEANNTLVLNPKNSTGPGHTADQDPLAVTEIIRFETSQSAKGLAIADLTDAYEEFGATRVWRGIGFVNNRKQVLLQDELQTEAPAELWWFINTKAKGTLAADRRSVVLNLNGKRLQVKILGNGQERLQWVDGQPLSSSPNPPNQAINSKKLAIRLNNVRNHTLRVLFTPLAQQDNPNQIFIPNYRALSDSRWPGQGVGSTRLGHVESPSEVRLYPNPNQQRLVVLSGLKAGQVHITVENMAGKLALSETYTVSENGTTKARLIGLPAGLYHLSIRQNSKLIQHKLVLE